MVGPTAVGKSAVAVSLAKKINAEIISCDSMQIYKGMDIIASIPSLLLRKRVPHHLFAFIDPRSAYNVVKYRRQAVKKIQEIIERGKIPLFVGGTGHYMSILLDGIFQAQCEDQAVRDELYEEARHFSSAYLHKRLRKADAKAALKIHPNDTKRIVRALEVFITTGKPISELQRQRRGLADKFKIKIFCLDMPRDKLYQRIEERIDRMFNSGLRDEVNKLLKLKLSKTASCAIGIKELRGYWDGLYDLGQAKRLMKKNTRNYAKRQLTWFRKDKRIDWIEIKDQEKPNQTAERILSCLTAA